MLLGYSLGPRKDRWVLGTVFLRSTKYEDINQLQAGEIASMKYRGVSLLCHLSQGVAYKRPQEKYDELHTPSPWDVLRRDEDFVVIASCRLRSGPFADRQYAKGASFRIHVLLASSFGSELGRCARTAINRTSTKTPLMIRHSTLNRKLNKTQTIRQVRVDCSFEATSHNNKTKQETLDQ